jgi:uncharacterized protein (UPF0261 family)
MKLKSHAKTPKVIQVWFPKRGISMIAVPDGPFEDQKADAALFDALRNGLRDSDIQINEDERAVNDEGFAHDIAEALVAKMGIGGKVN